MDQVQAYNNLEQGEQVHVEANTKALSGEWRAELRNGLHDIVDGVPKTNVVGIERNDAFGADNGSKVPDETWNLSALIWPTTERGVPVFPTMEPGMVVV